MEYKSYEQMKEEFRSFYYNEANGKFAEYEKVRSLNALKLLCFYGITFSVICLVIFGIFDFHKLAISCFILVFLLVGILIIVNKKSRSNGTLYSSTEKLLKTSLMPKFLGILLDNFNWQGDINSFDLQKFRQYLSLNILGRASFVIFDDIINGSFKDVKINIYEINTSMFQFSALIFLIVVFLFTFPVVYLIFAILFFIVAAIGSMYGFIACLVLLGLVILCIFYYLFCYKSFRGLIVEFQMNKNFDGHTFFIDKSLGSRTVKFNKSLFEPVKLEASDFSKTYNVYSNDQVEARYLLTTAFMERICNLGLAFKAKSVCGAFKDDKLTLSIDCGKDMFAMGSNFKKTGVKTFAQLFDEMVSILQIIDILKLNEKTGL